jgi:hypothetical protein
LHSSGYLMFAGADSQDWDIPGGAWEHGSGALHVLSGRNIVAREASYLAVPLGQVRSRGKPPRVKWRKI